MLLSFLDVYYFECNYFNEEYIDFFMIVIIVIIICCLMIILCYLVSIHKSYYEKLTGYECGFDPFSESRDPFDIKFYLISILFILFDIELLYFFPWCFSLDNIGLSGYFWLIVFYECFVLVFFFEWKKKTLFFD